MFLPNDFENSASVETTCENKLLIAESYSTKQNTSLMVSDVCRYQGGGYHRGLLASTTATAAKMSLLKWIGVFSNFVAFILVRWKYLM